MLPDHFKVSDRRGWKVRLVRARSVEDMRGSQRRLLTENSIRIQLAETPFTIGSDTE